MRVIQEIGVKTLYLAEGREASEWVKEPVKEIKTYDVPQMKSGLNIGQDGRGSKTRDGLLYINTAGNNIQHAGQLTGFYSTTFSNGNGLSVTEGEGWRRAVALLSVRDFSNDHWITHKDEYLAPIPYREVNP